jgi:hypothetical protein
MFERLKGKILGPLVQNQVASLIRDFATGIGALLATAGIRTGTVEEAIVGGLMVAFGLLAKFIDQADGPTDVGVNIWTLLIGPRIKDVSSSIARWVITLIAGTLAGIAPDFDWTSHLNGDLVSFIAAALLFVAQRFLKVA